MKKLLLMKTMLLLCALIVGSSSVWATDEYEELYSADFTSLSAFGYTQNKTFTLSEESWKVSVCQYNGGVFYLGCNSGNASKGVLNNNDDFSDVVAALANADAAYNEYKTTAHAYAMLFDNDYSDVSKITFDWDGTNNQFQVYLFGDTGSGWVKLANAGAASGASESGSISWVGSATNYTRFVVVARPGAANSCATSKTLRASSFKLYKTAAPDMSEETLVDIDASNLTNTDVYVSNIAGFLKASVFDSNVDAVPGAVVAWSSSDKSVATVGSDGSVTLVGAGSTTITASYAGVTGVYKSSSETYVLTVTDTNPNASGTINNPYTVAQAYDAIDNDGNTTNVYVVGFVSKYFNATPTVNANGQLSYWISADGTTNGKQFEAYNGKYIDGAAFTDPSDIAVGDKVVIYGTIKKYKTTYEADANNYIVKQLSPISKEVSADGWATYVTTADVEFEPENAFVVKSAGTNVVLSPVTKVKANTPLVLKGEGKKYVETLATTPDAIDNELRVSTGGTIEGYVLGKVNGVAGFYKWNGGSLTSGKVYLPASAVSGAREFLGFDFGDATAIETAVKVQEVDGQYYNLAGQRVAQPTKGLYIVNGRKVIIK